MGVKGFKVDFMDRDDQIVVNFYERMAATAATQGVYSRLNTSMEAADSAPMAVTPSLNSVSITETT